MKNTLFLWPLLAFTSAFAAMDTADERYMIVHDVKVLFRKSKRDVESISFGLYNVVENKGFACSSMEMPYYPMTPDFVSFCILSRSIPLVGSYFF